MKAASEDRPMLVDFSPPVSDAAQCEDPTLIRQFLRNVRGTIPLTIEQIDVMLRVIAAARDQVRTFLVLGGSDSLLASAILDDHPSAHGYLIDPSESEITSARRYLRQHADRLQFVHADFRTPDWLGDVAPDFPFDAIVSGSATLHSMGESGPSIYRRVMSLLRPQGIFINLEHLASATRWTESKWDDQTIELIFGRQIEKSPRSARADVARAYYAGAVRDAGVPAPLEVHCDWLRSVGFENVDCFLKVQELAMFGGQRPAWKFGD